MSLRDSFFPELTEKMLREGEAVLVPTRGSSMSPLISDGCRLKVEPVAPHSLRLGDIILYRAGENLVAHRLVGKRGEGQDLRLLSKGDAFPWQAREKVAPEQIIGRVTAVRRRKGREIRIEAGWGRILSLVLAFTWPVSQGAYLLLVKVKTGVTHLWRVMLPWG
jgi:hypothetical protein